MYLFLPLIGSLKLSKAAGCLMLSDQLWEAELAKLATECLPRDACVIITPSSKAGSDDYWNMDQMISQV